MYHITDIKKMERCERLFWLSRRVQKSFTPYVQYTESMTSLMKERLLLLNDCFEGQANDDPALALQAFAEKKPLVNARFAYEDLRIKVPVLIQEEGKTILYMSYRSCYPKEQEAQYIADIIAVLQLLDIRIDEIYAIHLNAEYIRGKTLDVHALLTISDHFYNSHNRPGKNIFQLVQMKLRDIRPLLENMRILDALDEIKPKRTSFCTRGNKCSFYKECFQEESQPGAITNLVQSQHKYAMKEEGIQRLKDADLDRIEGTRHQYAQIMADTYGGLYVDVAALKTWRKDHISYPLSYLDFEWETYAFPPYEGMKPFDVLTFQFSLHVEEEKGKTLQHTGFIGEKDCRLAFIEALLASVPKMGTILVYNMEGAEKLRLVQLAQQFPQYEKALMQIWERMVDLSLPFSTGNVYDVRMAGLFSLKTLVPIFSSYHYEDLAISYGLDAVAKWREYQESEGTKKQQIYEELTQYCAMDTYAEYIVYHALEGFMDV